MDISTPPPHRPGLYIGDSESGPSKFDRGSVEAVPDSSPGQGRSGETEGLEYYGAAKAFNQREEESPITGEVFQPLRQAVEARPQLGGEREEREDMQDLRDHFQSQHGQTFHQARQAGHSRTYSRYQADADTGDSSTLPIRLRLA